MIMTVLVSHSPMVLEWFNSNIFRSGLKIINKFVRRSMYPLLGKYPPEGQGGLKAKLLNECVAICGVQHKIN